MIIYQCKGNERAEGKELEKKEKIMREREREKEREK